MLISRGANILKTVLARTVSKKTPQNVVASRSSHSFYYRTLPPVPKGDVIIAEVAGGFMWWWILWFSWHDWGHVVGEYPYPDPSEWTDEELGIPPDD